MLFKDVIGLQETKRHLLDLVSNNRLSHALLFVGKEGSGALPLAMTFANFLILQPSTSSSQSLFDAPPSPVSNFSEPEAADQWMVKQAGFSKANGLVHPDIHFTYPVITKKPGTPPISTDYISEWREFISKYPYGNVYDWLQFIGAENKQGNITSNECNDIIRKLNLKSFESEYKVQIVWMPEYLGNEGNKLLKLIEEPPPNTLFLLVTENESLILPTILSRTQVIRIPPLEPSEIEAALVHNHKSTPDQARKIAAISEGNYREAQMLLHQGGEDWEVVLRDWLNAIKKTGPIAQVKWIEDVSKLGREKQKQFLRYFNHLLEQSIRLRVISEDLANAIYIPDNERDIARRINQIADISQQQAIIEELDRATYYIERNANAKMLFHALTIRLYHILAEKTVAHII